MFRTKFDQAKKSSKLAWHPNVTLGNFSTNKRVGYEKTFAIYFCWNLWTNAIITSDLTLRKQANPRNCHRQNYFYTLNFEKRMFLKTTATVQFFNCVLDCTIWFNMFNSIFVKVLSSIQNKSVTKFRSQEHQAAARLTVEMLDNNTSPSIQTWKKSTKWNIK